MVSTSSYLWTHQPNSWMIRIMYIWKQPCQSHAQRNLYPNAKSKTLLTTMTMKRIRKKVTRNTKVTSYT